MGIQFFVFFCFINVLPNVFGIQISIAQSRKYNFFEIKAKQALLEIDYEEWTENRYKSVSHTTDGQLCIDNCVNNVCSSEELGLKGVYYVPVQKTCHKSEHQAPVYFTSQVRQSDKATCLTRCGKFGWSYEWCFTTKERHWDYCSQEHSKKIKVQKTADYLADRCDTKCIFDEKLNETRCLDLLGRSRKCHVETTDFVQAKTVYGVPCSDSCQKHQPDGSTTPYYRCYDIYGSNNYCAPPADTKFIDFETYKKLHPITV